MCAPTRGQLMTGIPEDEVPEWKNSMINQQGNDDLYVEMTFMESLKKQGLVGVLCLRDLMKLPSTPAQTILLKAAIMVATEVLLN